MDLKVLLFDIVNEQNRPATPLICSELRCRVKLSANGSVAGLCAMSILRADLRI